MRSSVLENSGRSLRRSLAGVAAGTLLLPLLLATAAGASYGSAVPGSGFSPNNVQPSSTVPLEGGGFRPSTHLNVSLDGAKFVIGRAVSEPNGHFKLDVKVPKGLKPGRYLLEVYGVGANGHRQIDRIVIEVR